MVICSLLTLLGINNSVESSGHILWQSSCNVDGKAILLLCSHNSNLLVCTLNITSIANLTTRVTIERCAVKYHLICGLTLTLDTTHTSNLNIALKGVVADELALLNLYKLLPIINILCSSVTRTLLLSLKLLLKLCKVNLYALLLCNKLGKVNWESVCIVKHKGILTRNLTAIKL